MWFVIVWFGVVSLLYVNVLGEWGFVDDLEDVVVGVKDDIGEMLLLIFKKLW